MTTDFVHSFLFRDSEISVGDERVRASFHFDQSKEGWVGIPHGGIGMGAITELALAQKAQNGDSLYPLQCHFRMGGAEMRVGDAATIELRPKESGFSGQILRDANSKPYISGEIDFGRSGGEAENPCRAYLPDHFSRIEGVLEHIPSYRNCFVCGVDRKLPGLKRRFHLLNGENGHVVCAFAGFDKDDAGTVFLFNRQNRLHPMVLFAVLDETMGWAGFFKSANGGVSVKLNYQLHREVGTDEKLVFFARGEEIKGRIEKRMFFWASGCAAAVTEDGSFEVVAESSGQWLALSALTEQMKTELIPPELTQKIFKMIENTANS